MVAETIDRMDVTIVGEQGPAGKPPFDSAMAHDVEPGGGATADIRNRVLDIGVPRGNPGQDFRILDQLADKSKLPASGQSAGDRYQTVDDMHVHEWNGEKWLDLGQLGSGVLQTTDPLTGVGTGVAPVTLRYGEGLTVIDHRLTVSLTDAMIAAMISQPLTAAAIRKLVGSGGGGTDPTRVTGVRITSTVTRVDVGDSITLTCEVLPATATDKSVTWSSSDTNTATVDASTGRVTGRANGTATIRLTTRDGGYTASVAIGVGSATPPTPSPSTSSAWAIAEGESAPEDMPDGGRLVQLNDDSLVLYEMEGGGYALTADAEPTALLLTDLEQLPSNPPAGSRALVIGDQTLTLYSDGQPAAGSLRLMAEGESTPTDMQAGDRALMVGSHLTLSQWQ